MFVGQQDGIIKMHHQQAIIHWGTVDINSVITQIFHYQISFPMEIPERSVECNQAGMSNCLLVVSRHFEAAMIEHLLIWEW